MRRKRLTFIPAVVQWCENEKLTSTVRNWLPKLLPPFNESGLDFRHMRGSLWWAVDGGCLRHYKPDCLGEDVEESLSEEGFSDDIT